jgi:hypothetical protein
LEIAHLQGDGSAGIGQADDRVLLSAQQHRWMAQPHQEAEFFVLFIKNKIPSTALSCIEFPINPSRFM